MMRFLVVCAITISLFACKPEGRVYEKHKELSPDIEWLKKDVRQFEVPIENDSVAYNLSLSFRYAYGYQFKVIKVKVKEVSPSGAIQEQVYDLNVQKDNGEYIGEPGYDIWDSEHLIESHKRYLEKGVYTYIIEHNMPVDPVNYAMEIGVVLDVVIKP